MVNKFKVYGSRGNQRVFYDEFKTLKEAETYAGIEGTQMENDGVVFDIEEVKEIRFSHGIKMFGRMLALGTLSIPLLLVNQIHNSAYSSGFMSITIYVNRFGEGWIEHWFYLPLCFACLFMLFGDTLYEYLRR